MSQPITTVIVPAYQAASTLRRCAESVLSQDVGDLELIIVNDGSTDETLEIACELVRADRRVKAVSQNNLGRSKARNRGLAEAHGVWVAFVDADDYYPGSNSLSALLGVSGGVDVVWGGYESGSSQFGATGRQATLSSKEALLSLIDPRAFRKESQYPEATEGIITRSACGKLYRRTLLKSHAIGFAPTLRLGEDGLFNLRVSASAQRVSFVGKVVYHYDLSSSKTCGQFGEVDVASLLEYSRAIWDYCAEPLAAGKVTSDDLSALVAQEGVTAVARAERLRASDSVVRDLEKAFESKRLRESLDFFRPNSTWRALTWGIEKHWLVRADLTKAMKVEGLKRWLR